MIASTSTGADAVPAEVVLPAVGAAFVTGEPPGATAPPVPVGFADPPLVTTALPASMTLSQIFPKMLTHRLTMLE